MEIKIFTLICFTKDELNSYDQTTHLSVDFCRQAQKRESRQEAGCEQMFKVLKIANDR